MYDISFSHALERIANNISPLPEETVQLEHSLGRVTSQEIVSRIDVPSSDVSSKDGYALKAMEVTGASPEKPVMLNIIGAQFAGAAHASKVTTGNAIRITTGAMIPPGADAVLASEFAVEDGSTLKVLGPIANNILAKGTDIKKGDVIVPQQTVLMPSHVGLIAAAGQAAVRVHQKPRIAVIATGDEIVAPGKNIGKGKVAASNIVTTAAWCTYFHMAGTMFVIRDSADEISRAIKEHLVTSDCIITSGGAWKSERDLVVKVLDQLGWQKMFHRVKIGPGKAVGFGLLENKPVFCLPGGPPSNQTAFLHLALPGLFRLGGHQRKTLPVIPAMLSKEVRGQNDWTQFVMGLLENNGDKFTFIPQKLPSRLQTLARADGAICIPEGVETIPAGATVNVYVMTQL